MNRRGFFWRLVAGSAPLAFVIVLSGRCSYDAPATNKSFTSSVTVGHDHSLTVNEAAWINPPLAGETFTTTMNLMHTHSVFLSYLQLVALGQGEVVTVRSETFEGHDHLFRIVLKET